MVWGLFPVDSLPGAQRYYIFSIGTYKVGRKDCDIIVQTDRAVSRIHAEIIVNAMVSCDSPTKISDSFASKVHLRDCSKLGTFINKAKNSRPLNSYPNEGIMLKNGDLITFGTGNATFRFCFVPITFFIHCTKAFQANSSLQAIISSIGADISFIWSSTCTHALADESSVVTENIIEAVMAKKPVILCDWVRVIAEARIQTEFPSCSKYNPSLTLEGQAVKIVDPKVRDNCLAGYVFVLGSSHLYKFGDRLPALLVLGGARVLSSNGFSSGSQMPEEVNGNTVLVVPAESPDSFNLMQNLSSLSRVTEVKLIAAVLCGHLDSSVLELPAVVVSSSHSTDETYVEDSYMETDTATSEHGDRDIEVEIPIKKEGNVTPCHENSSPQKVGCSRYMDDGNIVEIGRKIDESDTFENRNSDIIYSQDLVVRSILTTPLELSMKKNSEINFKSFRRREILSGNSFNILIPFSKYPYKESDYWDEGEISRFMREEKKRKQMEAIAESLFNSEKVRRRGATGSSLHNFLNRN